VNVLPPPGPQRTRQLALLVLLAAAAAVVIWRTLGPSAPAAGPAMPPAAASNSATGPAAVPASGQIALALPPPLEMDKLESGPDEPVATRNPFRFGTPPPPPASLRPVPAYVPPAAALPPVPQGPPPIPLAFIGRSVWPDKRVIAALRDTKNGVVLEGAEGQTVDGRYRIVRIGEESLVIEYVNGTGRTTLQLR
jgi:hypothetical protein